MLFATLLGAYLVTSAWAGLDPKYPIALAALLLIWIAAAEATGNVAVALTLAEFVGLLLAGGILLMVVSHVRKTRRAGTVPVRNPLKPTSEHSAKPKTGEATGSAPPGAEAGRPQISSRGELDASMKK